MTNGMFIFCLLVAFATGWLGAHCSVDTLEIRNKSYREGWIAGIDYEKQRHAKEDPPCQ